MLPLKLDLGTGTLTAPTGVTPPSLLAGHRARIQLDIVDTLTARPLVSGEVITLQLAAAGEYDSALASVEITIADVDATITNRYSVYWDCLNSAIEALLKINGDASDDEASAACRIDAALLAVGETVPDPVAEISVTLVNSSFAAAASIPFATPAGIVQPFEITALSGNTATTLDGISTVNLPVGRVVIIWFNSSLQFWRLFSGTDATATGIQRPADYNVSTNAKVWKEIL